MIKLAILAACIILAGCVMIIASDNVDVDINAEREIDLNAN